MPLSSRRRAGFTVQEHKTSPTPDSCCSGERPRAAERDADRWGSGENSQQNANTSHLKGIAERPSWPDKWRLPTLNTGGTVRFHTLLVWLWENRFLMSTIAQFLWDPHWSGFACGSCLNAYTSCKGVCVGGQCLLPYGHLVKALLQCKKGQWEREETTKQEHMGTQTCPVNYEGGCENQTSSVTLTDGGMWECKDVYSSTVIWSGTLSTGKEETRNQVYGDTDLTKPTQRSW